jgi:hypothetical protein
MTTQLDRYLKSPKGVEGWLDRYSAELIKHLNDIQLAEGIAGSVGEIGVHHGRLFILLRLLRRPGETSVAIDVFGDQHLNTDGSGHGDLDRFQSNVERWSGTDDLIIIRQSSLLVQAKELLDKAGTFRLFSVDGGHTEECAFSDLLLADAVLSTGGVAILDDFSNHHWPSVAAGAARFFLDPTSVARPFATSPNKMYVAAPEHHQTYRRAFRRSRGAHLYRTCTMFGHEVDIYEVRQNDTLQKIPGMKRALKHVRRLKTFLAR